MENILLKYMSGRLSEEQHNHDKQLPIITISREYGCYASEIATLLSEELNKRHKPKENTKKWTAISKEILEKAAEDMRQHPHKISHVFGAEDTSILVDIINSFSPASNVSDTKIKKTITNIVRAYANEGNVIIVGRAGCVITKEFSKTLHVRISAPLEWRIKHIANFYQLSVPKAKAKIAENDKRRHAFMSYFQGSKPDIELFDVVFNRKTLTSQEIVDAIIRLLESKKHI